jgi:hypothetical protein
VFQTGIVGPMDFTLVDTPNGFSAQSLVIGNELSIDLGRSNGRIPFDIQAFSGPAEDRIILQVWPVLESKIIHYWTAPNIPHRTYMPHIR